ncbi:unnamed protein product [Anisakis simplex]|uniref:LITAF domain-containing protein n=1 Tax=Anisakis simplex TaxID=6269 RepID=A0A0M3K8L3_ANISI|nr:unnamed protein product [Anisakis simplex]
MEPAKVCINNGITDNATSTPNEAPPPSYNEIIGQSPPADDCRTSTSIPPHLTVIHATTPLYGPNPVEMDCPYCQAHVVTSITRVAGALPWIVMGVCFLLGFFLVVPWCICCIPFYIDGCLDVVHSCPQCRKTLGRHNKI